MDQEQITVLDRGLHQGLLILIIFVVAIVSHLFVRFMIARMVKRFERRAAKHDVSKATKAVAQMAGVTAERAVQRVRAIAALCRSIWTIVLVVVVVLTVLSILGIPLLPILTSAGIGGVILGFGAQSLVKDYLSGICLIVEDQYGVGDQITVDTITGTVEDVTLRITRLRDVNGMVWYLRNGEILRVGNVSQGYSTAMVDVPIGLDADLSQVTDVLRAMIDKAAVDPELAPDLLKPPELLGVESVTAGSLTMRILVTCPPNRHWSVARDMRERAVEALTEAGVPGPAVISMVQPPPATAD